MLYIQMYYSLEITKKRINNLALDGLNFSAYNYSNNTELPIPPDRKCSSDGMLWTPKGALPWDAVGRHGLLEKL